MLARIAVLQPWAVVLAAVVGVIWIVPEWPITHLDDPSHWGVVGFALVVVLLLHGEARTPPNRTSQRRVLLAFLCGMPLVYLANWVRFGGAPGWLVAEVIGAALYWVIAWKASRGGPWWAPIGIGGHSAWDASHHGNQNFVPAWYVTACVVADVALGLFAVWVSGWLDEVEDP